MAKMNNYVDDLFGEGTTIEQVKNTEPKVNKPGAFSKFIKSRKGKNLMAGALVASVITGAIFYNTAERNERHELNNVATAVSSFQDKLTQEQRAAFQAEVKAGEASQKTIHHSKDGIFVEQNAKHQDIPISVDSISAPSDLSKVGEPKKIKKTYVKESSKLVGIEAVTGFEVPKELKNNQVSAFVIKETVARNDFNKNLDAMLLATTFHREGFVSHVYNDVGYASVGAGQTVGVQSSSSVKSRFDSIGMNKERVDYFTSLANKKLDTVQLPSNYKEITISGAEGAKLSLLQIHKDFIPSVQNSIGEKNYDKILPQQKASLINLAYQKGSIGQTTSNAVKKHVDFVGKNPNATEAELVSNWSKTVSPTYTMSYTIKDKNGVVKKVNDERSIAWARTISDDFPTAQKILAKTITPKEAQQHSVKMQQTYAAYKDGKEPLLTMDSKGNIEFNDPMKTYREQAQKGEISFTVDKEAIEAKPKQAPKQAIFFNMR